MARERSRSVGENAQASLEPPSRYRVAATTPAATRALRSRSLSATQPLGDLKITDVEAIYVHLAEQKGPV
jgi:hypothetical protein